MIDVFISPGGGGFERDPADYVDLAKLTFKRGDQVVATTDAEASDPNRQTRRRFKRGDRGIVRHVWNTGAAVGMIAVRFSRKHSAGCVLVTPEQVRLVSIIERIADLDQ